MAKTKPQPSKKKQLQRQLRDAATLKATKPSFAIRRDYERKLKALSEAVNNSVSYWAVANIAKNLDKNAPTQLRMTFNRLLAQWQKKADDYAKKWAARFARQIGDYTDLAIRNNISANYTSDIDKALAIKPVAVKESLRATYESNLFLIKSIPRDIIERYQQGFMQGIANFDRQQLMELALQYGDISQRRAKMIARDQTSKATNAYHNARASELGFDYYVWNTSKDERVSKGDGGHIHLQGRIYKYSEPTAIIDSYGNKGHCGQRVNCLAKGQGIDLSHFPKRLFRLHCELPTNFVKLTFGDFALIVTRDHKMLTRKGWLNADALNIGDYVIKESLQDGELAKIDFNQNAFVLSDFFCLFDKLSKISLPLTLRFKGSGVAGDFDKDIRRDKDVDIIDIESLLRDGGEVLASECVKDFNLADSQMVVKMRGFIRGYFAHLRGAASNSKSPLTSPHGIVGFLSNLHSILFARISKAEQISLATRADMVAELIKSVGYDIASDPQIISNFKDRIATSISLFQFFYIQTYIVAWHAFSGLCQDATLKEVLQKTQTETELATNILKISTLREARLDKIELLGSEGFSNHIYSLETNLGYYSTNMLINKNCRCVGVSVMLNPNQTLKRVKDSKHGDYYEIIEKS